MKRIFSFALLWLCLLQGLQVLAQTRDEKVKWQHEYEAAAREAAAEHKPILMVFAGSDWCKPCILLRKEVWDTAEFQAYAKAHLVLLELDFPRLKKNQLSAEQTSHNEQLADRYNKDGVFPLVVLVDEQGKVLSKTGYLSGGPVNYIAHLESILPHN